MIKELTKNSLRNSGGIYIRILPGDNIHDIECELIYKYGCYYWNDGDIHQDTQTYINDVEGIDTYFLVMHERGRDIITIEQPDYIYKHLISNEITSTIIFREKKLKRLKRKMKK